MCVVCACFCALVQNRLTGALHSNMFSQTAGLVSPDHRAWPLSLRVLDLSSNVGLSGPLPQAGAGYADLATIDISNTSVSGALPASWAAFPSLQRLSATDTRLQCEFDFDAAAGAVSVGRGTGAVRLGDQPNAPPAAACCPQPGPFRPPPLRRAAGDARHSASTHPLTNLPLTDVHLCLLLLLCARPL